MIHILDPHHLIYYYYYYYYYIKLEETRQKLEELEIVRQQESERAQSSFDAIQAAQARMKVLEEEIGALHDTIQFYNTERLELDEERQDMLRSRTKLELDIHDFEVNLGDARAGETRLARDIKETTRAIHEREKQLNMITPKFDDMVREEEQVQERLDDQTRRRDELYGKQSRGRQFRTQQERDKWLSGEIKSLKQHVGEKRTQINNLKKEITEQEKLIASLVWTFIHLHIELFLSFLLHALLRHTLSLQSDNTSAFSLLLSFPKSSGIILGKGKNRARRSACWTSAFDWADHSRARPEACSQWPIDQRA